MIDNPILVEVERNGRVESQHRGSVCVCNPKGEIVYSVGDVETSVFPRSAVKAIQGLNVVESGAAEAFNLNQQELAVICSSHSGEEEHVKVIREMLGKAGLSEDQLECGSHWASQRDVMIGQAQKYQNVPPAIYNNCSGKHAGFLITAKHLGIEAKGYTQPEHSIQKQVAEILFEVTGTTNKNYIAIDGCSIPTYAMPLKNIATGFARMMQGQELNQTRKLAARRLVEACVNNPFFVAGTKRYCTKYMEIGNGKLFAKTGAEGVFGGGIVDKSIGIAIKCDDGATRASEIIMTKITQIALGIVSGETTSKIEKQLIQEMGQKTLRNWNKINVGQIKNTF